MEQPGNSLMQQRVAVSGTRGLVGARLCEMLRAQGHDSVPIVRSSHPAQPGAVAWDTQANTLDAEALAGCDTVVHLAGENIIGRWSDAKKQRIRDSRVASTRGLSTTLAQLAAQGRGPRTLIVASAIGYYGDTGLSDTRTEDDPPGAGFLSEVCTAWEQAADPAREAGLRVVHARIGIVLSTQGGALKEMLLPFKLGLGGAMGSGQQWMSWVSLYDLVRILVWCIETPTAAGPINASAPAPVTNHAFAKALGRQLRRPAILPAPACAFKLLYGKQCAEQILLASMRVEPKRLIEAGFTFEHGTIDQALQHELGRV